MFVLFFACVSGIYQISKWCRLFLLSQRNVLRNRAEARKFFCTGNVISCVLIPLYPLSSKALLALCALVVPLPTQSAS